MIRQDIRIADYTNIGESLTSYKYVVDLYKAGVDFKEDIRKKYVMVRKYDIVNGIVYDSDVYIIEKELLKTHPECVAYPITNRSYLGFSVNPTDFNANFSDRTFYVNDEGNGDEIYNIYEHNDRDVFTETDVPCDKIRIYHPNNKTTLNAVIYVDTMVRDTRFHLLCRPYYTYDTDAESDFELEHILYSEFIECYIPSIEYLLSGKAFYKECTQLVYGEDITGLVYSPMNSNVKDTYVALKVFSLPFIIKEDEKMPPLILYGGCTNMLHTTFIMSADIYTEITATKTSADKCRLDIKLHNNDDYLGFRIDDVTCYIDDSIIKYSGENLTIEVTHEYKKDKPKKWSNVKLGTKYKVTTLKSISGSWKKDDGKTYDLEIIIGTNISEIGTMSLYVYTNHTESECVIPAADDGQLIKYYLPRESGVVNGNYVTWPLRVTIAPYSRVDDTTFIYTNDSNLEMNSDVMQGDATMSLCATTGFDNDGNHIIKATFDFPYRSNFVSFQAAYEYYYNVDLKDYEGIVEYDEDTDIENEDDYVEQKQCGFVLRVYSDVSMKQQVGQFVYEIGDPAAKLNDFAFQTAGMFKQWEQLPNVLVFRCMFVDRWLGNIIKSNPIIITEETFKYFINNDTRSCITWANEQKVYDTTDNMDLTKINFIDKISCTIKKTNADKGSTPVNRNARVLYKPLFYRTQDLQTIKLRSGVTQNIGINLSEYMTKVETFKLTIAGTQVVESARNDIYVIFSINPTLLSDNTGTYNISNQDNEYISSGKFTVE
jgi:hypothetical protein